MAAVNPKIINFGSDRVGLEIDKLPIAAAQTWKKGAMLIFKSSALNTAGNGEIPTHIAVDDQTAPATSTIVEAYRLEVGVQLEVSCSAAVGIANVGVAYDMVLSGVYATLNLSATADACWKVVRLAADYEPSLNATADNPGKCIIEVAKLA
jgi:predicted RecA/RadA family phage recombinase